MKVIKTYLVLVLFFLISYKAVCQKNRNNQIINKKVDCPRDLIEKAKKGLRGFYYDEEYFKNLKSGTSYSNYIIIMPPSNGKEAKGIPHLKVDFPFIPDESKLLLSSLDAIEDMPPGATLTFENRAYKPDEIICVEIKGKPIRNGQWNPKVITKSKAKYLFMTLTVKATWNGLKVNVN